MCIRLLHVKNKQTREKHEKRKMWGSDEKKGNEI